MTTHEIENLKFWFNAYLVMLEDRNFLLAAEVAKMAFDSFLDWMENNVNL